MRRLLLHPFGIAFVALATIALLTTTASAAPSRQTADLTIDPSGGGAIHAEDAHLTRTPNGVSIRITMERPEAGSYNYPESVPESRQAAPEVFTGWAFVFANPGACSNPCNGDDFGDPAVGAGAYNFAGHVKGSGGNLVLSGHIRVGQTRLLGAPGGADAFPLSNPGGAEIHVAVAPHGLVDPSTLPGELSSPVGSPLCDCWWVAIFFPPV